MFGGILSSWLCPPIRSAPTSATAIPPNLCQHSGSAPSCEHGRIAYCNGHLTYSSSSPHFRAYQGVRAFLGLPFTTSALAKAVEEYASLVRANTDRRHGAKPIEGDDTYRGILASCRDNLNIYHAPHQCKSPTAFTHPALFGGETEGNVS